MIFIRLVMVCFLTSAVLVGSDSGSEFDDDGFVRVERLVAEHSEYSVAMGEVGYKEVDNLDLPQSISEPNMYESLANYFEDTYLYLAIKISDFCEKWILN